MVPYVPYGPVWSRMVPYGPVWSHIVPYGPVWSCTVLYGQEKSDMNDRNGKNNFKQVLTVSKYYYY